MRPQRLAWSPLAGGGEGADLHSFGRVSVTLQRLPAGVRRAIRGEEVFLIDGEALATADPSVVLEPWTWLRRPSSDTVVILTRTAATLWVKKGHLP
jgi:hypothetical protein